MGLTWDGSPRMLQLVGSSKEPDTKRWPLQVRTLLNRLPAIRAEMSAPFLVDPESKKRVTRPFAQEIDEWVRNCMWET